MAFQLFSTKLDETQARLIQQAQEVWAPDSALATESDAQRATFLMKLCYASWNPQEAPEKWVRTNAALSFELDDHVDALARLRREVPGLYSFNIPEEWGIPLRRKEVVGLIRRRMEDLETSTAIDSVEKYIELCSLLIMLCGMDLAEET